MRTLQEKYNGINEGAFSKEQFLRDARLQLPNLITQYNGYEDTVQILKNRGIIQENAYFGSDPTDGDLDHERSMARGAEKFYENGLEAFKNGDLKKAEELYQQALDFGGYVGWDARELPPYSEVKEEVDTENPKDIFRGGKPHAKGVFFSKDGHTFSRSKGGTDSTLHDPNDQVLDAPVKEGITQDVQDGQKLKNTLSGAFFTVDGKDETGGIYVRTEKGLRKQIPAQYFDAYEVVEEVNEARLTNKSLTDYRYKPTNDLDKYPYEQILRGLRVELEGMEVTGTPTTDEYKKALAKVLKNLHADEIFYTNQLAATDKKVDDHDQLIAIQGKEKEIKNSVDTFNGLKKAALKEGFKKLITKVLSENADPLHDYYESKESKKPVEENSEISEAPSVNNPKIEKLIIGINDLISKAVDQQGDPIGVIWPGGTWDEPYIYHPIQYKNGQLKVTSKSVYGGEPETETVLSRDMELDGIPMLRTLMRMYKKAVKNNSKPVPDEVNEDINSKEKTLTLKQLHKIAMKAGNFGSDVKDALVNLYMGYGEKTPISVVKKVLANYDLTFADLKDQPATFVPSSEFAYLFNSSIKDVDEVSYSYDDREEEMDDYLTNDDTDQGVDVTGASNATGEYEIMMHMLDASITNRSEAAKFFSLNYSDMPEQQIEYLINHYFQEFQEEEVTDTQVDEIENVSETVTLTDILD